MIKRVKSISVRRGVFLLILTVSFLSLSTLSALWIYSEVKSTKRTANRIKKLVLSEQKDEIKEETNRAIQIINTLIESRPDAPLKEIQNEALSLLQKVRYGYGGYVFVNTYDGFALINDGKIVKTKTNIKDAYDPEGNNLFILEMNAAKKPGGDFIEYYYNKLGEKTPIRKISYVMGFDKWRWIVGSGDYVVDAEKEAAAIGISLRKKLKIKVLLILMVFAVTLLTIIVVSEYLSKKVSHQLNILVNHFKTGNNNEMDSDRFWIKELNSISKDIVIIEEKKKETEAELRRLNESLEKEVESRIADLRLRNKELERYNQLFADREFRIKELRDEIKRLKTELEECKKWISR